MSIKQTLDELIGRIRDLENETWRSKTINFLKDTCGHLTTKKDFIKQYQEIALFEMYNFLDSLDETEKNIVINYFLDIDNIQSKVDSRKIVGGQAGMAGMAGMAAGMSDPGDMAGMAAGMGDPAAMAGMASGMGDPAAMAGMASGMGDPAAMAGMGGVIDLKKEESMHQGHAMDILEIYSTNILDNLDRDDQVQPYLENITIAMKKLFRDFFQANRRENLRFILYPISKYAGMAHKLLLETITKSHLDDYMRLYFTSMKSFEEGSDQAKTQEKNMFEVFIKMSQELINVTSEPKKYSTHDGIKELYENMLPKSGGKIDELLEEYTYEKLKSRPKENILSNEEKLNELIELANEQDISLSNDEIEKKENSENVFKALQESLHDESIVEGSNASPEAAAEKKASTDTPADTSKANNGGDDGGDGGDDDIEVHSDLVTISDSDDDSHGDSGVDSNLVPFSDSDEE